MLSLLLAASLALDGLWDFRFEEGKSLEDVSMPAFVADDKMLVPGCWDVQPRYYNLRGTGCFRHAVNRFKEKKRK